jgi:Na+-translocating ferredoxin:NAD+ oxidoreductase RNF subunit RnfB
MQDEFRSINIVEKKCRGRMACMRICPTQAIRVTAGHATLLKDRCIDCGECVRVCPNSAIVPLTGSLSDFSRFKHTIAIPSPVIYSQFGKDIAPSAILNGLTKIGFDDSYDVACAAEAVSIGIQEHLDHHDSPRPLLSPFCPVVVRLIQLRYPNLLDNLIPIESPMEIAAREAKRLKMKELGLKASEIGAIYITPCPAKTAAMHDPPRKKHSFLDGTIAISEIYPTLFQALSHTNGGDGRAEIRGLGLGWPIVGGQMASLRAEDCLAIGGLTDAVRIFEEIENGKLEDVQYIECNSCPTACVGGSLNVENPYVARGRVLRLIDRLGSEPCQERERIRELYQKNFFSLPGQIPPTPIQPLDQDVSRAIQKMRDKHSIFEMLPQIDCGACGSPTCITFAEDVIRGDAVVDDCLFVAIKELESVAGDLFETLRKHGRKAHSAKE